MYLCYSKYASPIFHSPTKRNHIKGSLWGTALLGKLESRLSPIWQLLIYTLSEIITVEATWAQFLPAQSRLRGCSFKVREVPVVVFVCVVKTTAIWIKHNTTYRPTHVFIVELCTNDSLFTPSTSNWWRITDYQLFAKPIEKVKCLHLKYCVI